MKSDCEHLNFQVNANVGRLTESPEDQTVIAYVCELRVFCRDCGVTFEFVGLPLGFSHYHPTVSIDGKEGRFPIMLPGVPPKDGLPGFTVKDTSPEGKVQ